MSAPLCKPEVLLLVAAKFRHVVAAVAGHAGRLQRHALRALLLSAAISALSACAYGHRITYRFLEGPMDAIALTHVRPDRLLVLSGTEEAGKSVSVFYDSIHSLEILRFPVSRYATGIQGRGDGKFLLSIARPAEPQTEGSGAIEEWNLRGQFLNAIPFNDRILAITRPDAGVVYALMGSTLHPVIIGTRIADGKTLVRLQVRDAVDSIDQCRLHGETYVLTSSPKTHFARLIDVKSGFSLETPLVAEQPRCLADGSAIVGLHISTFGTEVSLLALSTRRQRAFAVVAPPDAVAVEPSQDGRLFLLRRSGDSSSIQIWKSSELSDAGP